MLQNKVKDCRKSPALEEISLKGQIAEQMELFLEERVCSEFAKNVIYMETEEEFRIRRDDDLPLGVWNGEYWGKWVIGACQVARYKQDANLTEFIRQGAHRVIATADPDGYIGTYKDPENYFACDPEVGMKLFGKPWNWNWNIWCRKYTLWGLLECYELTKDDSILQAAIKTTRQLINMLKRKGTRLGSTGTFNGLPSGSILKPMLILYRLTEDEAFLQFALEIAQDWERKDGLIPNLVSNALSGKPVHEWYPESESWAKAYEMMSDFEGLLELYRVTGEKKYLNAVENFHKELCFHEANQLFSVGFNDMFANASRCQNVLSELCDVIHWIRLNYELYCITGKADYVDIIERAYYNPFLAGALEDGKWGARCVRTAGRHAVVQSVSGAKHNHCCVNNMPRGFMNTAETYLMLDEKSIYINFYTDFVWESTETGRKVEIGGSYLRDGKVSISIDLPEETRIYLRIPGWSKRSVICGELFECPQTYVEKTLNAGHSELEIAFDMTPVIREMEDEIVRYSAEDIRVWRYLEMNPVTEDAMFWEKRSSILYGPLLLTRSKKVGNTEDEMFHTETICGKGYVCEVEPAESEDVRNAFKVSFKNGKHDFETMMCDYATGTNRWSKDDDKFFNIYI